MNPSKKVGELIHCILFYFAISINDVIEAYVYDAYSVQTGFVYKERSGSVVECLTRDRGFEPHRRHCVVSLSKNINPCFVLVQPRKTRPFITEILLMGRKESTQTYKETTIPKHYCFRTL